MAGLFDYDPNAAKQQSLFAALLASAPQLMAAGAPSTQPGAVGRGIGAFGPAFIQAQQGYMNNQQNSALRAMQMKKMEQELATQAAWQKMFEPGGQATAQGPTIYDTQGGEMLSETPTQGNSLFDGLPKEAFPFVQALGPKAGSEYLLKSRYDTPANMREWEVYNKMSPEDQQRYLTMKRSQPSINLGGSVGFQNPAMPGQLVNQIPKTPPPEQMPDFKGAQAAAKTAGENQAKRDFNMMGIGDVIDSAESYLTGQATGKAPTASGIGSLVDTAAGFFGKTPEGAVEAESLRAIGGALTSKMPRMEGPQSDKDTMMYREMAGRVGDDTIPIDRRIQALNEVKRLWRKYDQGQATGQSSGKRLRYNPQTGNIE